MSRIIAIANQKGGVGKTTSAVNISAALAALGKKTLLVDLDPQGNATSGVGISKKDKKLSVYETLIGEAPAAASVCTTAYTSLYLLPSAIRLAGAELELANIPRREFCLKNALNSIAYEFDYIIIDCPPSLGLLTINALCAANRLIVPMQCEYFALEGLSQLMYTVRQVKNLYNPTLDLVGVLLTMFDGRLNLSVQVMEEIKKFFPGKVFRNAIPRSVRLSEAPSYGKPIFYYDKYNKGSLAYTEAAKELISRCEV